ncbi:MAG: hypothetical protein P4L91_06470 [Burkholderiaceae bacterium]|nr:hypothetical protein [Burkholderiaceae bacterium]
MESESKPNLFHAGQLLATPGAMALLDASGVTPWSLLLRHVRGDWGNVSAEDQLENRLALQHGDRLLSCYLVGGEKIWLITEANRSSSTLLLPNEY